MTKTNGRAKPIRVLWSPLSGRFFATAHYREKDGKIVVTGAKTDVTNEIAAQIAAYGISFEAAPPEPVTA